MPALSSHQASSSIKLLFIGDSGSGKTGALASLAAAGYKLRIIDLDAGLDVLFSLLTSAKSPYSPDAASRVHFKTITDPMKNVSGKLVPSKATVWPRILKTLDNWDEGEGEKFGPLSTWGADTILVLDSLTFAATGAMNYVLSMNGRLGQAAQQSDWYQGQQLLEGLLQLIYDEGIKCNVIINCHITYIGDEQQREKGYPASLGKALSPKIGRYFNTMLMARTVGVGAATRREITTQSTHFIELKTSAPLNVAKTYPIETGLADYFKAVVGAVPGSGPKAQQKAETTELKAL